MSKIIAVVSTFTFEGEKNGTFVEYESGRVVKFDTTKKTHVKYFNECCDEKQFDIHSKHYIYNKLATHTNEMTYFEHSSNIFGHLYNKNYTTIVYTHDIVNFVAIHFLRNSVTDKFFEVYGIDTTTATTETAETVKTAKTVKTAEITETSSETATIKKVVNSVYGLSEKMSMFETVKNMIDIIFEKDTFIECSSAKELIEKALNCLGKWTYDEHEMEYHVLNKVINFDEINDILRYIENHFDLNTIFVLGFYCTFYIKKDTKQNYGFNFEENMIISILKSYSNKSTELFDKIDINFDFSLLYYLTHAELIDEYFKYITLNIIYVIPDSKQSEQMFYKLYTDFLKKNLTNDVIIKKAMQLTYFNDMFGEIISDSIEKHYKEHGFIFDFDDFTETFTSLIDISVNEFTHLCVTIEEKTDIVDIFYKCLYCIVGSKKLLASSFNDTIIYYKYDKYLHKAVDILNTYANEVWE